MRILSHPDIPTLESVYVVKTSLRMDFNSGLPFKHSDRMRWTSKEQSLAAKAQVAESLDEFSILVCVFTLYIIIMI
jgi:hypothetical protein